MTIIGLLLLCLAWLWPGHYYPWFSAEQDALAILGLIVLGTAVLVRVPRVSVPGSALVVVLVAIVPLIQWGTGLLAYRSDALLASTYLCVLALAIVVGCNLRKELSAPLFLTLLIGALLQLPIGIAQWWGVNVPELIEWVGPGGRVSGNLKQPNQLASLLALGVVAAWWLFEDGRLSRSATLFLIILLVTGMALTQSRTPWLIFGLWLVLWMAFKRRMSLQTPFKALVAAAVAYVAVSVIWQWLNVSLFGGSARPIADQVRAGPRTAVWKMAIDAIVNSPWYGYGWQPFHVAEIAIAAHHPPTHYRFESAHNLFLDLLLWNGVLIGLLLSAAIVWWIVRQLSASKTPNVAAAVAALFALLAHSAVELPLQYAYFLVPAGLLIGIAEAQSDGVRKPIAFQVPRLAAVPLLALLSALMATVFVEYREWRESHQRLQYEQALKRPTPGYQPWVPDNIVLDGPEELMRLLMLPPGTRASDLELKAWRTVAERYGTGEALLRYAQLARSSGREDEAEHALSVACRFTFPKECKALRMSIAAR